MTKIFSIFLITVFFYQNFVFATESYPLEGGLPITSCWQDSRFNAIVSRHDRLGNYRRFDKKKLEEHAQQLNKYVLKCRPELAHVFGLNEDGFFNYTNFKGEKSYDGYAVFTIEDNAFSENITIDKKRWHTDTEYSWYKELFPNTTKIYPYFPMDEACLPIVFNGICGVHDHTYKVVR